MKKFLEVFLWDILAKLPKDFSEDFQLKSWKGSWKCCWRISETSLINTLSRNSSNINWIKLCSNPSRTLLTLYGPIPEEILKEMTAAEEISNVFFEESLQKYMRKFQKGILEDVLEDSLRNHWRNSKKKCRFFKEPLMIFLVGSLEEFLKESPKQYLKASL